MMLDARIAALAGAIRDKINAMMPRLLPAGGAAGQVLAKASSSNYQAAWADGAAGGANVGQTTLDFGTGATDATVVVVGQTLIGAGSHVLVSVAVEETPENTADDVFADPPMVMAGAIVPGTGFTIFGRAVEGTLAGTFKINWMWG